MTELRCKNCNELLSEEPKAIKMELRKKPGFISGTEKEPISNEISITCSKCGTANTLDLDTWNKIN